MVMWTFLLQTLEKNLPCIRFTASLSLSHFITETLTTLHFTRNPKHIFQLFVRVVFLKWIVALHCESLKCWQTYLDRYHQIRIDFDEWTVQKGGMNSGHIKFFSAIKEIKINSMIKDISSIFFQQDPFCVVKTLLLLFECFQVWEGKNSKS